MSNIEVNGAKPIFTPLRRGISVTLTSTTLFSSGTQSNWYAPVTTEESRRA